MSASDREVSYSVVFMGEIIPGFEKKEVISKVMQYTQLSREEVETRFFQGGKVVIKKTNELEKAKRYHNKFLKAGMAVGIHMDFDEDKLDDQ